MNFMNKGGHSIPPQVCLPLLFTAHIFDSCIPLVVMFCYILILAVICFCALQFPIILLPMYFKLPSFYVISWQLYFYLFHVPWLLSYFYKPATTWTTVSSGIIQTIVVSTVTRWTHTSLEHQDLYLVTNSSKNMSLSRTWWLSLGRKDAPFPGKCV